MKNIGNYISGIRPISMAKGHKNPACDMLFEV